MPADGGTAADDHLRQRRDRYPTLAEHGHVSGNDWDATFTHGLTYLLDGITARLASSHGAHKAGIHGL